MVITMKITYDKNINEPGIINLASPQFMKTADSLAMHELGTDIIGLVDRAAYAALSYLTSCELFIMLNNRRRVKNITFICGGGNNGADGYAMAALLSPLGYDTAALDTAGTKINAAASYYREKAIQAGVKIYTPDTIPQNIFAFSDIIIDAVFGTGFCGRLPQKISELFSEANKNGRARISVDLPSGTDGATGEADEASFRADLTITFEFVKQGSVIYPAADFTGELAVIGIGFPKNVRKTIYNSQMPVLLSEEYIKSTLPRRGKNTNKGDYGKLLCMCGSENMTGAAFLSAGGAIAAGAGLVFLAVPEKILPVVQSALFQPVFLPLTSSADGLADFILQLNAYTAILVGPGLGKSERAKFLTLEVIKNYEGIIILDADSINIVSENINILREKKPASTVIFTPHPGEMARLCGTNPAEIQKRRLFYASSFALEYGCIVVLKGAGTIICRSDGMFYVNPTGNAGLSKGGSGDVLAGVMASFAAQGIDPVSAALAGVYLHGRAADIIAQETGEYGLSVRKLPEYIAKIIGK